MIYFIAFMGVGIFVLAAPALIVGRCTELMVRRLKSDKPPK